MGQNDKAKTALDNCLLNCVSAISEITSAIHYSDSASAYAIEQEKYVRLAESETVSGQRMLEFSETAAELSLTILDTVCEKGAENLSVAFLQIDPIKSKMQTAIKLLNLWLDNKEKRNQKDLIKASRKAMFLAKYRLEQLKSTIEKAKQSTEPCLSF